MKTLKHIIVLLTVVLLVASMNGCKKDFDKINDDPNNPKDVPTSYLLSGAQKGLIDNTSDYFWNGYVGNQLAQYWATNLYTEESRFLFRTGVTNDYWSSFYSGGLNDLQIDVGGMQELQTIINSCKSNPAKYSPYGEPSNQIAIATALKVWSMQNITDTWGDVPYSEALQGAKNPQPKFDKQSDIYTGLFAELDSAAAGINMQAQIPVQGDLIYGGDMSLWMKFINSLKLRLAIRIADVNLPLASAKITEAVNGGVFTGNADNALFGYLESSPSNNPMFHEFEEIGRRDFCASNTFVDVMRNLNDTSRIKIFFNPVTSTSLPSDTFIGRPYGQNDANASNTPISDVSQPGDAVISATTNGIYLDYAQVEFMLAEAAERGIAAGGDAATHYNNAIKASFEYWNAGDATDYLAQDSVDYNSQKAAGKGWRHIIGKQKWIALYMQGVQGWIEWRRLDFDILQLPVDGALVGNEIPKRMLYPVEEQTLNSKSYGAAVGNMGADDQSTKVWWDIH